MKPFDLEAFKNGAVARTRGGQDAHLVAVVHEVTPRYRLIGRVGGRITTWGFDGKYRLDAVYEDDLIGMLTPRSRVLAALSGNVDAYHDQLGTEGVLGQIVDDQNIIWEGAAIRSDTIRSDGEVLAIVHSSGLVDATVNKD